MCLAAGLLAAASQAGAAIETLTLYQKSARASLVVRGRAKSDETRRPRIDILEVLKGSYPGRTLTIAPHVEERDTPWLKREVFRAGEESLLFLLPYVDEYGRDEGSETFMVLHADQGKIPVPAEGGEALLQAVRRFAAILALRQHDRQAEELRHLLREQNPYLIEAGLTECRRFRLAEPDDLQILVELIGHRRADFRAGAVALLGQIAGDGSTFSQGEPPTKQAVFERVAAAARLDPQVEVRREAVAALESIGDLRALAVVDEVGRADVSQEVRYLAQVAAYRLREKLRPQVH